MKRKILALIFNSFREEYAGKDVFLVPYYLGKELNAEVNIIYQKTGKRVILYEFLKQIILYPIPASPLIYAVLNTCRTRKTLPLSLPFPFSFHFSLHNCKKGLLRKKISYT